MLIHAGPTRRQAQYLTVILKLQRQLGRRPSYRELGNALEIKRESAFETVQRLLEVGMLTATGDKFKVLGHE